jgi:hypothetical protein
VNSYWRTLANQSVLEIERGSTRSHYGEVALEEAMDLSLVRNE